MWGEQTGSCSQSKIFRLHCEAQHIGKSKWLRVWVGSYPIFYIYFSETTCVPWLTRRAQNTLSKAPASETVELHWWSKKTSGKCSYGADLQIHYEFFKTSSLLLLGLWQPEFSANAWPHSTITAAEILLCTTELMMTSKNGLGKTAEKLRCRKITFSYNFSNEHQHFCDNVFS